MSDLRTDDKKARHALMLAAVPAFNEKEVISAAHRGPIEVLKSVPKSEPPGNLDRVPDRVVCDAGFDIRRRHAAVAEDLGSRVDPPLHCVRHHWNPAPDPRRSR